MYDEAFWNAIDSLVLSSRLLIDRPKGSCHPRFPALIYPLDYGYLDETASMDGGGIDVWVGSAPLRKAGAVMCTVDLRKRDSEVKILLGCNSVEMEQVVRFHNYGEHMKGLLIRRVVD